MSTPDFSDSLKTIGMLVCLMSFGDNNAFHSHSRLERDKVPTSLSPSLVYSCMSSKVGKRKKGGNSGKEWAYDPFVSILTL